MITAISWRNVWRSKLRSIVIMSAITLGLTGGIFSVAIFNGMSEQKLRSAIDVQTSHIQIHQQGFRKNKDIRLYIPHLEKLKTEILSTNHVDKWAIRTVISGMAATSNGNAGIQLNGIIPEDEKQVTTLSQMMIEGEYFETQRKNQIVVGKKLADKLEVKLGSKIIVTLQDANGEIVGAAFRVSGIFKTPSSLFDESQAFVRKGDLEKLAGQANTSHEIAIRMNNIEQVPEAIHELQAATNGQPLAIESWREVEPELAYLTDSMWQINYLFLAIILAALAFGILNTMLMAIFERVKELGVLMAVGMNKFNIFKMIVLETVFLSLSGALVGIALSFALVKWINQIGINLSMFAEGLASYGLSSIIYPNLDNEFYLSITLMVIITAILASIYPAIKALQLKPVEAIHG
ncbi:FtsX-like permease family protein [Rapidithrix thailandica]|uniref:FtsX-like permease family protein n=1 Tax=Rapidithrix thailandica TaxID=413964 RepID=A0AAW9S5S8_9BACT